MDAQLIALRKQPIAPKGYVDEKGRYHPLKHENIGGYEIINDLGKGAFGSVLKARHIKTGKIVALKMICNEERFRKQAKIEVAILKMVKKTEEDELPNHCCEMIEFFEFETHPCIVFEMYGIDLYTELKAGRFLGFKDSLIDIVAKPVVETLVHLKKLRIVHCDIKPENILFDGPEKQGVKVIDFGTSCYINGYMYSYVQSRFYRAPEVILRLPYEHPVDMWSFGCILVELHTGKPLFPGYTEYEMMVLMVESLGIPPTELLTYSRRTKDFFTQISPGEYKPLQDINRKGRRRLPGNRPLKKVCGVVDLDFIDFVSRCLTWDPDVRITPEDALKHPYITKESLTDDSGCVSVSPAGDAE